ncbi:MAG TPA: ABC transporter ATP-binding protein [Anaerolineales bacterium]|nr:ABC transporter ATP-binding protein [Anaerolineales bacterium]
MSDEPILRVVNLTKKFSNLVAVNNVSFQIGKSEIVGLIGPNGAGKTTLFNLITGLEQSDSGQIFFKGANITHLPPYQICRLGMSRTFQVAQTFTSMTVADSVRVGAYNNCDEKNVIPKVNEILELCHLDAIRGKKCGDLSLVQLRRVELARAIATGAEMLLLDEAGAGLTATELAELMALLSRLNLSTGITLCVVEHVMQMVMGLCRHIIVLDSGLLIAEGNPDEVRGNPDVIEAYLGVRELEE